jgi:hypothetical protein
MLYFLKMSIQSFNHKLRNLYVDTSGMNAVDVCLKMLFECVVAGQIELLKYRGNACKILIGKPLEKYRSVILKKV